MSTSKLQRRVSQKLSVHFGRYTIRENYRPEWLYDQTKRRLELDFYIDELRVAIEVQGDQHYHYSSHFHRTPQDWADQQMRDTLKAQACEQLGLTLFELSSEYDLFEILWHVRDIAQIKEWETTGQYSAIKRDKHLELRIAHILQRIERYGRSTTPKRLKKAMSAYQKIWELIDARGLSIFQQIHPRVAEDMIQCMKGINDG